LPLKPSTYAKSAHLALAHSIQITPLLSRALKEVLIKVADDPKPSQTSGRLVESSNATCSSKASKVLSTRKLDSGNVMITAEGHKTKNLIEHEEEWTRVIAGKAKVRGQWFRVMVDNVRTSKIKTAN
jgi:hypothetical protein